MKKVTWTKGIDPETGKPAEYDPSKQVQVYNPRRRRSASRAIADICPGNMGGKNWPPTAYNPELKLWYIPVIESCNRITIAPGEDMPNKPREFFTGGGPSQPFRITGSVTAIDVTTGKVAGKYETQVPEPRRHARDFGSGVLRRTVRRGLRARRARRCRSSGASTPAAA